MNKPKKRTFIDAIFIDTISLELANFNGSYYDFYVNKKKYLTKQQQKIFKQWLKLQKPKNLPYFKLYCDDIRNYKNILQPECADWVITDPPYSKKFLWVYDILSEFSSYVLKPHGALIVMVGQSYLPEIINKLSKHLKYIWTLAYLTPGGQSPYIWKVKCNTFWKPVLLFAKDEYLGDSFGDVIKTSVNNNDKRFHKWGQSEEGFDMVFEKFVFPGQTIIDPFVGGGTTAVVALKRGCNFIGIDISKDCIKRTEERIKNEFCLFQNQT
jgi:site-specific DNA-methyltransferase (adenine-specific)